ncbi:lipopolysaccharide heptosyltransferase I [Chitinibacter bivalviorum]|uniref:Lipopolysaccharide heptosyltransferase 1 n=1 Tax=Chitinibacter bivalviorum TaxID=2739434 RepID=A0A7H9BLH2_9NEIS|nr:lipopolysaccharide heptosyltransferase I [Chitinibacter bivalviorum]QLG88881.1 lipopolysaccharide heptosyltransferase I [Chitinibacter bivalviorum]
MKTKPTIQKILIVRMSSMGDVIHQWPAITDLARVYPDAAIDWVVEEGFAELPRLHPAIRRVIPVALRRWRKSIWASPTHMQWQTFKTELRACRYDLVLDAQGLIKSAAIARLACGPVAGFDRKSIREPLASLSYCRKYRVSKSLHAIDRNRQLSAAALDYKLQGPIDYGLQVPELDLPWLPDSPYAVCLTATSRADKEWAEANWILLGQRLLAQGIRPVFPWGSATERARAERLAAALPAAMVAPKLSLSEAASLLAKSKIVIGVDTGLVHLAAAVAVPTVAIFCASDPELTGIRASSYAVNLGQRGQAPSVDAVWDAVQMGWRA